MKNIILSFFLISSFYTYSQWENLNSGITDNLTGIVFLQNTGLVSGENGLYYTTNGGNGNASWSRFEITNNTTNADIYNNTSFTNCFTRKDLGGSSIGSIYACGQHTDGNAIIMRVELPSLEYQIFKLSGTNGKLNDIDFKPSNTAAELFFAVGDGMIVRFSRASYYIVPYTNISNEDLHSIDFGYSSPVAAIGSNYKYYKLNTSNYALDEVLTPNIINKDIWFSNISYSVGNSYVKHTSYNSTINNNFDYGPLNADCLVSVNGYNSKHLVGTDHGIFLSDTEKYFLEWQPSSQNYNIKSLWDETPNLVYACGDNGVILKTQNQGGNTKPYIALYVEGDCVNNSIQFASTTGTSTNCQWFVDDVLFHTGCDTFYHIFNQVGEYEIKLIGTNDAGEQTEKTKIITIVNPPEINKPTTIQDQILCQGEQLNIQIENSELDVFYTLRNTDDNINYGESNVGNDGTISFLSNLISTSGEFYLEATNIFATDCTMDFTQTFDIVVEKTKADFHVDLINANINEEVFFYEKSIDSQNFEWTFDNNAASLTSNISNPINTYSTPGSTNINLNCWSDNGCYDDIDLSGPTILSENTNNQCWEIEYSSNETFIDTSPNTNIYNITEINEGFLSTGYFKKEIFESTQGTNLNLNFDGGFLTKTDFNGVLKWGVYSNNSGNYYRSSIIDSVEDSNGNIFITGDGDTFHDNKGNVYNIPINYNSSYIIKLDSRGNLIWHITIDHSTTSEIKIDSDDNLIVNIINDGYNNFNHFVRLNGVQIHEISSTYHPVVKFSNDGNIIWEIGFQGISLSKISTTDSQNNIYVTGGFSSNGGNFYSANNPTPTFVQGLLSTHSIPYCAFIAKYDANGVFQWAQKTYTTDNGEYKQVTIYDMKTDDLGNIYIVGYNNTHFINWPTYEHVFENSDGSLYINNNIKPFFLQKINTNGISEWLVGTNYSFTAAVIFPKLTLKYNKIYLVTSLYYPNIPQVDIELTSTDNNNITFPFSLRNIFIASYNPNGTINKVLVNNGELNGMLINKSKHFRGLVVVNDENFVIPFNIDDNDDTRSFIKSLNENCSSVYLPRTLTIDDNMELLFSFSPNPSNGIVNINSKNEINKIEVFDKLGKLIIKETNKQTINISSLAKGIYIIKIEGVNGGFGTKKIIKN